MAFKLPGRIAVVANGKQVSGMRMYRIGYLVPKKDVMTTCFMTEMSLYLLCWNWSGVKIIRRKRQLLTFSKALENALKARNGITYDDCKIQCRLSFIF